MNIGVFFTIKKESGGGYQYALMLLEALKHHNNDTFTVFSLTPDLPKNLFYNNRFKIVDVIQKTYKKKESLFFKINNKIHNALLLTHLFSPLNIFDKYTRMKDFRMIIKKENVDIMIFPQPYMLAAQLDMPIIAPIHDMGHKLIPQFPEFSKRWAYENKEYLCSQMAKKVHAILVDSEMSKEDIMRYYNTPKERIVVLPFLPPNYLHEKITENEKTKCASTFHLPKKFLFFPAQIWPHKNHLNLFKAISILKTKGEKIHLVLTGGKQEKWGAYEEAMNFAKETKIDSQIQYLGYVENENISVLFCLATAFINPTYLGPTNIPIMEAWKMGCPVLHSDVRGYREQAGDAALFFDPDNAEDIAEKINSLWHNEGIRNQLIKNGKKRLELWTENDFINTLNATINTIKNKYYAK